MKLDSIRFVLTPDWHAVVDETNDGRPITRREYEDIDAFTAEMQEHGGVPVKFSEVSELPESLDGVLLIAEENAVPDIAARLGMPPEAVLPFVFLVNIDLRPSSARHVDELGAAGGLESRWYFVWRTERVDAPGGGVLGRKEVATRLGATWRRSVLWETDRYCFMAHDEHETTPALLAAYLGAYAETL
jgi:hypothetical protein